MRNEPPVYALARLRPRTFTPSHVYKLFLAKIVQAREDRGYSLEQLAELVGLTPQQVASFESGEHPLGFIDVRNWLLALDMPFVQFTREMEEVLDSSPTSDETITYPTDPERYARAAPLPCACACSPSRKRIGTLEELLRLHPELREICVDATEQQVPKPQNKRRNRQSYSGKSHAHTVKTQITSSQRLILHIFGNCPGNLADRLADRSLLKASGVICALSRCASPLKRKGRLGNKRKERLGKRPPKQRPRRVRLDRGYSGIEKQYLASPHLEVRAALKGTSKSKVTLLGKLWNRLMVSTARIQIEQDIAHLKNWRVLSGLYRAQVQTHAQTVVIVAGLHNFNRLGRLHW